MPRFTLTIDTDDFDGNTSSKLSRALRNAASRVEHGAFELGTTFNITVDGKVVGEYRHVAKRKTRFTNKPEAEQTGEQECECFGDSGMHASTHIPQDSDREHCDLCGKPVRQVNTTGG